MTASKNHRNHGVTGRPRHHFQPGTGAPPGALCLDALLQVALTEPSVLNIERMAFAQKVKLTVAVGCIGKDYRHVLDLLNRFRNRMAHDLNVELTEQAVRELVRISPASIRTGVEAILEATADEDPAWDTGDLSGRIARRWFLVCIMHLGALRNRIAWEAAFKTELQTSRILHEVYAVMAERFPGRDVPELSDICRERQIPEPPTPQMVWN